MTAPADITMRRIKAINDWLVRLCDVTADGKHPVDHQTALDVLETFRLLIGEWYGIVIREPSP